jgi:NAD+ kinase
MMVLTPVCPHALHTRPWVISAKDRLELIAAEDTPHPIDVSLDGEVSFSINKGESIHIRRADGDAFILKTNKLGFYDILRTKLGVSALV